MKEWVTMRKSISISLIFVNIIYVIITVMIVIRLYNKVYRITPLQTTSLIIIGISTYGLIKKISRRLQNIILTVSCVITVIISIIFVVFLPPYTVNAAHEILAEDPMLEDGFIVHRKGACLTEKHGNPFAGYGYTFEYLKDGNASAKIYFDPITGDYNYFD